jgi:hypothetical protein
VEILRPAYYGTLPLHSITNADLVGVDGDYQGGESDDGDEKSIKSIKKYHDTHGTHGTHDDDMNNVAKCLSQQPPRSLPLTEIFKTKNNLTKSIKTPENDVNKLYHAVQWQWDDTTHNYIGKEIFLSFYFSLQQSFQFFSTGLPNDYYSLQGTQLDVVLRSLQVNFELFFYDLRAQVGVNGGNGNANGSNGALDEISNEINSIQHDQFDWLTPGTNFCLDLKRNMDCKNLKNLKNLKKLKKLNNTLTKTIFVNEKLKHFLIHNTSPSHTMITSSVYHYIVDLFNECDSVGLLDRFDVGLDGGSDDLNNNEKNGKNEMEFSSEELQFFLYQYYSSVLINVLDVCVGDVDNTAVENDDNFDGNNTQNNETNNEKELLKKELLKNLILNSNEGQYINTILNQPPIDKDIIKISIMTMSLQLYHSLDFNHNNKNIKNPTKKEDPKKAIFLPDFFKNPIDLFSTKNQHSQGLFSLPSFSPQHFQHQNPHNNNPPQNDHFLHTLTTSLLRLPVLNQESFNTSLLSYLQRISSFLMVRDEHILYALNSEEDE